MKRNAVIDIMKALGIILMVLGHSGFVFTNWIYQFHMAMFFIIAGYCFKDEYIKDKIGLLKLLKNRLKSLYLPCLLFNSMIVLFHNFFLKIHFIDGFIYNGKEIIFRLFKCLLFSGGENLSGAMWFLRTMFFSTILFAVINFLCYRYKKNNLIRWIIYNVLLFIGWKGFYFSFGKYFNILTVLILFQIGNYISKNFNLSLNTKKAIVYLIVGFLFTSTPLFFTNDTISLASNRIINPFYFIFCSCSGTLFCVGLSNLLKKIKLSMWLEYIGKNTLPIVMGHFMAMKIVTLIQILIYHENISLLSSHPYLHASLIWCIFYVIIGISVPLIIQKLYYKIKKILERNKIYEQQY